MYGNGQSATGMQSQNQRQWNAPGPIQRPNSNAGFHQNYQQQRRINPATVNNSGMTMNPQGKSQYFNAGSKRKDGLSLIKIVVFKKSIFFLVKPESEKSKSQSSPTKVEGVTKIE